LTYSLLLLRLGQIFNATLSIGNSELTFFVAVVTPHWMRENHYSDWHQHFPLPPRWHGLCASQIPPTQYGGYTWTGIQGSRFRWRTEIYELGIRRSTRATRNERDPGTPTTRWENVRKGASKPYRGHPTPLAIHSIVQRSFGPSSSQSPIQVPESRGGQFIRLWTGSFDYSPSVLIGVGMWKLSRRVDNLLKTRNKHCGRFASDEL
jgi:hypothetical protein